MRSDHPASSLWPCSPSLTLAHPQMLPFLLNPTTNRCAGARPKHTNARATSSRSSHLWQEAIDNVDYTSDLPVSCYTPSTSPPSLGTSAPPPTSTPESPAHRNPSTGEKSSPLSSLCWIPIAHRRLDP
jgi:hypothetical protein